MFYFSLNSIVLWNDPRCYDRDVLHVFVSTTIKREVRVRITMMYHVHDVCNAILFII